MRIGVFICWCGTNIKKTVDVEKVAEEIKSMPRVVFSQDVQYLCSEVGQREISEAIDEYQLDRIVVGSCSPRMHEPTFQKLIEKKGLNPYFLEIANIREQCSWVHPNKQEATKKALELMKKAVAKIYYAVPLHPEPLSITKRALVVGGGIAGIQAALDIAEAGYPVDLVEKEQSIGGRMAQLDKTFPTLDCSACILTPKMVEVANHPNINLINFAEVEEVGGYVGNFQVKIRQKAKSIHYDDCTGCGICMEKCPQKVTNEFDEGTGQRKAVYTMFPQAVPNKPVIDRENCRQFQGKQCGVCQKLCPVDAVDYEQEDEILEEEYGAIVTATGFDVMKPHELSEFGYGESPDILTSIEFERLLNASGPTGGEVLRPSDGKPPHNVVFIQCVGSRDNSKGNPHCSKICCMYTTKHTVLLKEKLPQSQSYVFYIDVRTGGKDYEEFYERARRQGTTFFRGQVSRVDPHNGKLLVRGYESSLGELIEIAADMVVLATSSQPKAEAAETARTLGLAADSIGFYSEAHPKLRPVETQAQGLFLAGACQGPKDIPEAVAQASGAASKAISLLNHDEIMSIATTAMVDQEICSGCMQCESVCPYEAITKDYITEKRNGVEYQRVVAYVNRALCQGCGACAGACKSGAMDLGGFTDRQLLAEVDSL